MSSDADLCSNIKTQQTRHLLTPARQWIARESMATISSYLILA